MVALCNKFWDIIGGIGGDGGYAFITHGWVSSHPLPFAFDWVRMGALHCHLCLTMAMVLAPFPVSTCAVRNLGIFRFNLI
jgi:hypothetical protein